MKTSQIVAKACVRLFFLLLLIATFPFFQGDNSKLHQLYFVMPNKWLMIFPALLVVGFIILFITCTVNKYKDTNLNWVLVVNTAVLLACGISVYFRVLSLVK
jgi:cytochrome bd-type quinol oxidase subunit 2